MIWPTDNAGIVDMVLAYEGGFVDNPNDKGGPTNFGITIDTLASWRKCQVTADDIKNLTSQEAGEIYQSKYLVAQNYDQLTDVKLRAAMVDFGVLCGPVNATMSLQSVLGQIKDGICGPATITAANANHGTPTINQLSVARINFHADRVSKRPDQIVFFKGWISRAVSFIE